MLAAILVLAGAALGGCGSSGSGLIPAGNAGPLQEDFQLVAEAATEANGNCEATEEALEKTDRDFRKLPPSVDAGLRERLAEGIRNLRTRALKACEQPSSTGTTTTSSQTTTKTTTSTSTSEEAETETSSSYTAPEPPATSTIPTESGEGGGTEAPSGTPEGQSEEEAGGGP